MSNLLVQSVERLIEYKTITCDIKNKWFDSSLQRIKKLKKEAYIKANLTNMYEDWEEYKIVDQKYKKEIKLKSNKYSRQCITKVKSDPKKLWKCISALTKASVNKPSYSEIQFEGVNCTDRSEFSTKFNNFFIESINNIIESIPVQTRALTLPVSITKSFKLKPVTVNELTVILNKFKNKCNKDDLITTIVLKDSFSVVGYFFVVIVNETFASGQIPEKWKTSTVIPIPKILKTREAANFRPIKVLPISEKLMESAVKNQFLKFIEEENIIHKNQSGFREKHSCETSFNFILSKWKEAIDKKEYVITVFLDFRRAFETIDHKILLRKLEAYGVRGAEINWFQNYVEGRLQSTSFEDHTSLVRKKDHGVPQGSVLGLLLFILYINDIVTCVKNGNINLFADDTLLCITTTNIEEGISKLNEDLTRIYEWLNVNKLKLNVSKTKWMILSKSELNNINSIKINNEEIERVKVFKYLGITIDENLKFNEHLTVIKKKISSKTYLLSRIRKKIDVHTAKSIYVSSIQSHLDYCSSVLFLLNTTQLSTLQTLQHRALRIILKRPRRSNCKQMLSELNLLNVTQRIDLNVLSLIFKLKNNLLPLYLCENVIYVHNIYSNMKLRNSENFRLPSFNTTFGQTNLFYKGLSKYNNLPPIIKNCKTLTEFRKNTTDHLRQVL